MADFSIGFRNNSGMNLDQQRIVGTAGSVMRNLRLHPRTELSITAVTSAEMERLHIEHMDEPGATDVLSFPMDEIRVVPDGVAPRGYLGDIVLCPEFAAAQAATAGHDLNAELDLLLTHGILHCLGHDHLEPEEHAVMFGIQAELLAKLALERGEA